ncbi:hypothetical protein K1T71_010054 [Dendrolimus kikuchii]|uniref:Uncharacterized protein n=1 Tax=Dendrolimus kikuchii TaxID=765133 RepID=A0ACC1CQW5_9NEOP|nr:hypothetical protein K1T71_010054 [Dendrolimus kikuchii]
MPVKLYKIDGSPPVRAVLMTADILKLDLLTENINTTAGEQMKPEFLQKNPLHTVPVLEDGDFALADSHSIITYLVSKYGAEKRAELYPVDLKTRAIIDQRLFFDTGYVFPRIKDAIMTLLRNKKLLSPEQITSTEEVYGFMEKYLEASKFLAGNHITLADISLVASVSSLDVLVPIDSKYIKLKEWFEVLKNQEWYQNGNVPGLTGFAGFVKATIDQIQNSS